MRKLYLIIISIAIFACKQNVIVRPVQVAAKDTLSLSNINLCFVTQQNNWKAILYTFAQPIELLTTSLKDSLKVNFTSVNGTIESPVALCLIHKDTTFLFKYYLKNTQATIATLKDYRSSKTVNPDSSLQHDKVLYALDKWQNLQQHNGSLFLQQQIGHAGIVKTENAIQNNNLSAFYVQPGSATNILLSVNKDALNLFYILKTNIIKDRYNNIIANGTKVCFEGKKDSTTTKMFSPTIGGSASIKIPIKDFKFTFLKASIQSVSSSTIYLN